MTRPGWSLLLALWVVRPDEVRLREILRVLPDVIRLLRRLAADSTLPRGIRVRLVLLLAYLALPVDLLPDFVPVLGHADDAIIVALGLRSACARSSAPPARRRWKGTGRQRCLSAVRRLARVGPRVPGARPAGVHGPGRGRQCCWTAAPALRAWRAIVML